MEAAMGQGSSGFTKQMARNMFGSHGWALVHRPAELPQQLARAYASLAR
jgi:hypothetical protein